MPLQAMGQQIKISSATYLQPYAAALEMVVTAAGLTPQLSFLPGERSILYLTNNQVDAEFARTKAAVESMQNQVILVGPIACAELVAFSRADSAFKIAGPEDLKVHTIGIPLVNRFATRFAENNHLTFTSVAKIESIYGMLNAGRFDIALDVHVSGLIAIRSQKLGEKVTRVGAVLDTEPAYLIVNSRHKDWAQRLQKAFDESIRNHEWQAAIRQANISGGLPKDTNLSCIASK